MMVLPAWDAVCRETKRLLLKTVPHGLCLRSGAFIGFLFIFTMKTHSLLVR